MTNRQRRSPRQADPVVEGIIRKCQAPIGAYAIVDETRRMGNPMVPVQVYRSLDRLADEKRIERIASLKAYAASASGANVHLLCRRCGAHSVVDGIAVARKLERVCRGLDFVPRLQILEVNGDCRDCSTRLA